jgi:predicted DNA-binding transcriptional regulator AlpA
MPLEKPVGQELVIAPELMNATQTAVYLGCSERHVQDMHRERRMPRPTVVRGRRSYWCRRDLKAWIDAGCPAIEKTDSPR